MAKTTKYTTPSTNDIFTTIAMLPEETQKEISEIACYYYKNYLAFLNFSIFNRGMGLINRAVREVYYAKSEEDFSKALDNCIDVGMRVALTDSALTKDDYDNYLDTIVSAIDNKSSDDELLEVAKSNINTYKWVINIIGGVLGSVSCEALINSDIHLDPDQWMKNSIELAKKNLDEAAKVASEPAAEVEQLKIENNADDPVFKATDTIDQIQEMASKVVADAIIEAAKKHSAAAKVKDVNVASLDAEAETQTELPKAKSPDENQNKKKTKNSSKSKDKEDTNKSSVNSGPKKLPEPYPVKANMYTYDTLNGVSAEDRMALFNEHFVYNHNAHNGERVEIDTLIQLVSKGKILHKCREVGIKYPYDGLNFIEIPLESYPNVGDGKGKYDWAFRTKETTKNDEPLIVYVNSEKKHGKKGDYFTYEVFLPSELDNRIQQSA